MQETVRGGAIRSAPAQRVGCAQDSYRRGQYGERRASDLEAQVDVFEGGYTPAYCKGQLFVQRPVGDIPDGLGQGSVELPISGQRLVDGVGDDTDEYGHE